jgi:predicted TIM-barrel fold metal-dependent hydrolase
MYSGPFVDCDIHHELARPTDLLPYLSRDWQEYVKGPGRDGPIGYVQAPGFRNPHGDSRDDSYPTNGGPPGSDCATIVAQLLDPYRIERGILTYGRTLFVDNNANPHFAAEIARASNDWTADYFLSKDDRLYGSILVSNQSPDLAAKEVRQRAANSRFAQVLMANVGINKPLGHPIYHPIYQAAADFGLPIAIHAPDAGGATPPTAGHGELSYYIEFHTLNTQSLMTHLVSFIAHGVFELFPDLKLILIGGGAAWVPALLWRFDTNWKGVRREVPWIKKLPSEYFAKHVRITTQPLEASPTQEQLIELLSFIGGEDILLFATNYPHWDLDQPDEAMSRLPEKWLPKVSYENAMKTYGWSKGSAGRSTLARVAPNAG